MSFLGRMRRRVRRRLKRDWPTLDDLTTTFAWLAVGFLGVLAVVLGVVAFVAADPALGWIAVGFAAIASFALWKRGGG